jgi:hypothetical protein
MRTPIALPPSSYGKERAMLMPRHFKQKKTLNERFATFANDTRVYYIAVFSLSAATILIVLLLLVFQTGAAR